MPIGNHVSLAEKSMPVLLNRNLLPNDGSVKTRTKLVVELQGLRRMRDVSGLPSRTDLGIRVAAGAPRGTHLKLEVAASKRYPSSFMALANSQVLP